MLIRIVFVVVALSPLAIGHGSPRPPEKRGDSVLLKKTLSGNREIALVVGTPMPLSEIAGLLPADEVDGGVAIDATGRLVPHTCAFCLQLRLIVPEKPAQIVWSELLLGPPGPDRKGCDGLDMMVTPDEVVLALAHASSVELVRVNFATGAAAHYALSGRWTDVAASRLLDRAAVSVRLSTDRNGAVLARVKDLKSKRETMYAQDPERWQFSEITSPSK